MNIQELKEKIMSSDYLTSVDKNLISNFFFDYEQSNKSEEELDSLTSDELQELIYSESKMLDEKYYELFSEQKKEIEALKKQVEETNKVYNEQYRITNSVSESVQELEDDFKTLQKTFNKIYNNQPAPHETKQERFYYKEFLEDSNHDGYFEIIDKKNIIKTDMTYDIEQVKEICSILNSLEGK